VAVTAIQELQADYAAKIAELDGYSNAIVADAQANGRDLDPNEYESIQRNTARITELTEKLKPLADAGRQSSESLAYSRAIQEQITASKRKDVATIEYRSVGAYLCDWSLAGWGDGQARERMNLYTRAAAHQTTPDNLGVIPEPIVGPLINFVDQSRPIVNSLGPQAVPSGRFNLPRVTQHTNVAKQTAEKAELVSQKMLIERVAVAMDTYGGYVNISRQDIDWSVPSMMDVIVNDLAAYYARVTETAAGTIIKAGSTAQTPVITASSTAAEVTAAIWKAVATIYTNTAGAGGLLLAASPDMMVALGQLFAPVNPTNSQSSGFSAGDLASGVMGTIAGVPAVMSYGLAAGTVLLINTASARVFEQRIGTLQVTEPSVIGVQVAYAGYFQAAVTTATGVIKLTA
jgi:HK97 family phage major capsid protein